MPTPQTTPEADGAARHEAAARFLASLPEPWTPGPIRAHRLAPVLLERLDATGWTLGPKLRAHLTANPQGVRSHGAVLTTRVRDLEPPEGAKAPPPRPACSTCGSTASLVHGTGRCVRCTTSSAAPPASDPAAFAAEVRAALRRTHRAS